MKVRTGTRLLVVVAAAGGLLVACGGGGGEAGEASATTTAPAMSRPQSPQNLGFEDAAGGAQATAWGGGGEGYVLTSTEDAPAEGRRSGRIQGKPTGGNSFGTYTQCLAPDRLKGKRIVYRGMLRTGPLTGDDAGAGLWLRVDGPEEEPLFFDNMSTRPVRANSGWASYEIVVPQLPETVTGMCFGALLVGEGILDVDALTMDIA